MPKAGLILSPTVIDAFKSCNEPKRGFGDVQCALFGDSDADDGPHNLHGDDLVQWELFESLLQMELDGILDACNEETLAILKEEYTEAGMYWGD